MLVELILLDNVEHLGEMGDVVKVASGFARNYLIPKGLASKATPGTLRQLEVKKMRRQDEYDTQVVEFSGLAERISNNSITIPMQADDNEKLYGSVSAQQIVESLCEMNVNVEKKQVALSEPIRKLGVFSVDIHLHREVTATTKVWVVKA